MNTSDSGLGGRSDRLERGIGVALFLLFFTYYALQVPAFAVPGRWAGMLSAFLGLEPFRTLIRPIWSGLMFLVSVLPITQVALLVNLFSALLGALLCWLIFEIVRRIPFLSESRSPNRLWVERWPRLVAGLFAVFMAGCSVPMLTVATRGDFSVFDVLLLLLPVYLALLYKDRPRLVLAYASFITFGLALAEYPSTVIVAPGFLIWWVWQFWETTRFKGRASLGVGLSMALAWGLVLASFVGFQVALQGAETGTGAGFFVTLREVLRLYALELVRSVPKVGWLLLIGTNLIPLFFIVFRPQEEPRDIFTAMGVYPFRLVLFLLGLLTLFELPGSPSRLMGYQVLLVLPYLIAAIWFGHFIGYHYGLLTRLASSVPRYLYLFACSALILTANILNVRSTNTSYLKPVVAFSDGVVAGLQGRTFLVTDGTLDSSLRVSARQAGHVINLLNLRNDSRLQGSFYASLFTDPDMKNAAYLGVRALLNEWMHHPASLTGQVAVLTAPHSLPAAGFAVYPAGLFYQVDLPANVPAPDILMKQNEQAWTQVPKLSAAHMNVSDAGYAQLYFLERWFSRMANDVGVNLDDRERPDLAELAYQQSLAFWPDNISASMNLLTQAQQRKDADQEHFWSEKIKRQAEENPEVLQPNFMRQVGGEVRNALASYQAGSMLVRSGQIPEAMEQARQAAKMLAGEGGSAQVELARLFLRGNQPEECEKLLRQTIEKEPGHLGAYQGLLQLALHNRNYEEAGRLISRMDELGLPEDRVAYERAYLDFSTGHFDEAKKKFQAILEQPSPPADAWYILACIAAEQKDQEGLQNALNKLRADRSYPPGQFLLGEYAMKKGDAEEARRYFERVLVLDPSSVPALTRLAQLDFDRRNAASLRIRAGALLALDPDNAFGHYAAANVHLAAGRLDLAETALRRSLASQDYDVARNDLAWILNELGESDEALVHARRAVEMNPKSGNYWDTIASIQQKRGEIGPAQEAMGKALELSGRKDPFILLNVAALYAKTGAPEKARECLAMLKSLQVELPESAQRDVEKIEASIPDA